MAPSTRSAKWLLVSVIDAPRVQLVGDDQFRLRPHELSPLGAMNQAFLEEPGRLADNDLARQRVREEIGHATGDFFGRVDHSRLPFEQIKN